MNSEAIRIRELPILIDKYLSEQAAYAFEVGRNKNDEYSFNLEKLSSSTKETLTQNQAMTIVPTGSYWSYFSGCRDIFGIPLPYPNTKWVAFGCETTIKHANRGAFLYLKAVFLPFPLTKKALNGLERIASEIFHPQFDDAIPAINKIELDFPGRRKTQFNSPYPSSFHQNNIEGWVIRKACQEYENQQSFIFRTLAMKKVQLSTPGNPRVIVTNKQICRDTAFQN